MIEKFRQLFQRKEGPLTDAHSLQGRKPSQQDAWYISPVTLNGQLIFVADGVGGHAHGEFAANLAVELFRRSFEADDTLVDNVETYLREQSMQVAAQVLHKSENDPEYKGCGTTLAGFFRYGNRYRTLNIGDSRVYHFSEAGGLKQLTKDHTIVQELLDQGAISAEEARNHPQRNMMYSAIGQALDEIRIDIGAEQALNAGDWLLAFSDGVHDALPDAEIARLIHAHQEKASLCATLTQAAYDAGGKDNITAVAYRHP